MYLFENHPKKVSQDFYSSARKEIVDYYSTNSDIVSIYEYGSVSSPGVSDLDIILVLKNLISSSEDSLGFLNISDDVHSLVADGNVMKMPESVFCRINEIDKFNVKRIYGKELLVDSVTNSDKEILRIVSVIDWLPERVLRLTKVINSEVINIANVLCILHSFTYSIENINQIVNNSSSTNDVIDVIKLLRNDWYSVKDPESVLIGCIKSSITLGYKYITMLGQHLEKSNLYQTVFQGSYDDISLELFENHYIKFKKNSSAEILEGGAKKVSGEEKVYVFIPEIFYLHFYCLSAQEGILSDVMKGKINPNVLANRDHLSEVYEKNLIRKIMLAEENAQFLKENNLKKGLIRYGFHFRYQNTL